MEFNIQQNLADKSVVIGLNGRINTATSQEVAEELKKYFSSVETMILDFAGVEYISSAGLRMLIDADETMSQHGKLVLRNVGVEVREVLEVTGFNEILHVEE